MDNYLFSIVIPTFRRMNRLAQALDSLAKQEFPKDQFEVIVVDDQSGERFDEILGEFSGKINVQIVVSEVKGRPGARNTGAQKARGEFLLFIDDDINVHQEFLEAHFKALRNNPEKLVVGKLVAADKDETLWTTVINRRFLMQKKHSAPNPDDIPFAIVTTGNLSMSRRLFLETGCFDEITFSRFAGEDPDFGKRWVDCGRKIMFLGNAVALHFEGKVSFKEFLKGIQFSATGVILYLNKNKGLLRESNIYKYFPVRLGNTHLPARSAVKSAILSVVTAWPLLEFACIVEQCLWRICRARVILWTAIRTEYLLKIRYYQKSAKQYWSDA
jgi:glycosyltransferase involved in cell wall biosynthesis